MVYKGFEGGMWPLKYAWPKIRHGWAGARVPSHFGSAAPTNCGKYQHIIAQTLREVPIIVSK